MQRRLLQALHPHGRLPVKGRLSMFDVVAWKTQCKVQSRKYATKDKGPKKPTRSRSAYNFFLKERSKTLRAANPDQSMPNIFRLVADEWKNLSDTERQVSSIIFCT